MVCCTTLWWDGAGKGRGWKTAAIIYCWQQQHVCGRTAQLSDISSGATCVADLDSRALALTKEASGNSHDTCTPTHTPVDVGVDAGYRGPVLLGTKEKRFQTPAMQQHHQDQSMQSASKTHNIQQTPDTFPLNTHKHFIHTQTTNLYTRQGLSLWPTTT